MKNTRLCRDYRNGDEEEILGLYQQVNNRRMALAYWRWRYIKNPFGVGIMKLLFEDERLIGYYAVLPTNVQVDNSPAKAVFSLHTMTHPDFQKQGIFTYLAEETYKVCQDKGFQFVYGFPNENSYHGFTTKLAWTGFGYMTSLEKTLNTETHRRLGATDVYEVDRFDEKVDALWERVKDRYRIIVPRTRDYLNWRFAEHPTVEYPKYVIVGADSGVLGYMVLKIYRHASQSRGHIVDMLTIRSADVVKSLLDAAYHYFVGKEIASLSCWMPEGCFCTRVLEEEGFTRNEFDIRFGVRRLEMSNYRLRTIEQLDNWHLTMSDVDVF